VGGLIARLIGGTRRYPVERSSIRNQQGL